MTAGGQGAPDISTDSDLVNFVKAGWVIEHRRFDALGEFPGWAQRRLAHPGRRRHLQFLTRHPDPDALLQPGHLRETGHHVPENYTFTQDEFVDVVKKCSAGGYAGVADAVGNRNYPALFPIWAAMTNLVGREEQNKYDIGLQSWDTPEARQVLEWMDQLTKAGMWPSTFSTMTIDEFHVYFHTQQKACMLFVPSWYPGRAFKSEAEGGQSPDFHFKMLRYPLMNGAKFSNQLWTAPDSGYQILSTTKYPEDRQGYPGLHEPA